MHQTERPGMFLEPHRHDALHPELDHWRVNVGSPVTIDTGEVPPAQIVGVDVLCWNLAIGLARLGDVITQLRAGAFGGAGTQANRPLVILAQEAYRADSTVPGASASDHHGGPLASRRRVSVVDIAEQCGLSLRYSPSMRNGAHASDRGNAVLSTMRLADSHAFLLPYVRQRRVVVTAQLAGQPDLTFVSAHLDTHGSLRTDRARLSLGAGRAAQAQALAAALAPIDGSVVFGADLNSLRGMTDPAVRALMQAGMHPARRVGTWRHTYHTPLRLLLDHVLYRSTDHRIAHAEVIRLDEAAGDRSRTVFGSDHHPLLARLELNAVAHG
ncbi:MAG TPA: endonuclease/exonuclease/phosphatase family protein [Longimicrobiales bacterium]|nr:endonuclease/exonuclease/phosphatase family protein [Longimicrobiales bacterium]